MTDNIITTGKTKQFIQDVLAIKRVPYLSGDRGIGKSAIVKQVADENNLELIDIRLSQMLPEDLIGIPRINDKTGKAEYTPFNLFPIKGDKLPKDKKGWLIFLDELSSASEDVMAAAYKLILDRQVGNYHLHQNAFMVAAGNRSTDSAIASKLPQTLINRMIVGTITCNHRDWIKWAEKNGNIHQSVVKYINQEPEALIRYSKSKHTDIELDVVNTPRSWEAVSDIMKLRDKRNTNNKNKDSDSDSENTIEDNYSDLITGAVGAEYCIAFKQFVELSANNIDIYSILEDPEETPVPDKENVILSLIESFKTNYENFTEEERDKIIIYVKRFPEELKKVYVEGISKVI